MAVLVAAAVPVLDAGAEAGDAEALGAALDDALVVGALLDGAGELDGAGALLVGGADGEFDADVAGAEGDVGAVDVAAGALVADRVGDGVDECFGAGGPAGVCLCDTTAGAPDAAWCTDPAWLLLWDTGEADGACGDTLEAGPLAGANCPCPGPALPAVGLNMNQPAPPMMSRKSTAATRMPVRWYPGEEAASSRPASAATGIAATVSASASVPGGRSAARPSGRPTPVAAVSRSVRAT